MLQREKIKITLPIQVGIFLKKIWLQKKILSRWKTTSKFVQKDHVKVDAKKYTYTK